MGFEREMGIERREVAVCILLPVMKNLLVDSGQYTMSFENRLHSRKVQGDFIFV